MEVEAQELLRETTQQQSATWPKKAKEIINVL